MWKPLWRAFVDGHMDNDEKVTSKKKYQINTRLEPKPYPIWDHNSQNQYPIYDQNGSNQ